MFFNIKWLENNTRYQIKIKPHLIVSVACRAIHGVSKKVAPPKTFWNIFTLVKSLCVKFCGIVGNSYPHVSTNFCRFRQMALIFFTGTHCFHPVKFWIGPFTQKMQMQLFRNDVIFSLSHVLVSDNCKQTITVRFLLLTFYWHCFKAWCLPTNSLSL